MKPIGPKINFVSIFVPNLISKKMKKIYLLLVAFTSFSFGQITDSFLNTGLLNANGWTTHSGTAGQLAVSTGSIPYSGITAQGNKVALVAGNSEDVNKSCGTAITNFAYYSCLINVPNVTGLNLNTTTGDYPISLGGTTGSSVTTLPARIYFRIGTAADKFNIGVLNNSGGTVAPSFITTDYSINTPIFVVVKYDRTTNTASLFVNPTLNSTEPTASATNATGTTVAPAQIASIAIRQAGNATAGTGNVEFDEIKIADNWAYVTTSVLGSDSFSQIDGLKMYPNPAKNNLFIETTLNSDINVSIIDVLGKEVINSKVSNNAVNISGLTPGMYIVKITEEGKTSTKKLIIE
jgi:hypothetical protein